MTEADAAKPHLKREIWSVPLHVSSSARLNTCLPWSPNTCLVQNAFEMERVRANSEAEAKRKETGTALASRKQAKAEKKQKSLAALGVRPIDSGALIRVCS